MSTLVFRNGINRIPREAADWMPLCSRLVIDKEALICPAKNRTIGSLIKHANEIALRVVTNLLHSRRVWIVATDAAVGPEPDDIFPILKDCVDMIRSQTTGCAIEGEPLHFLSAGKEQHAATVGGRPNVLTNGAKVSDCTGLSFIST